MNGIKTGGVVILGLAAFVAVIFVLMLLIKGTAYVGEFLIPHLAKATAIGFLICVFILLPMAGFKITRGFACWGFLIASYLFGAEVWFFGFLITYDLWGGLGIIIGLFLGIVGIVPLGIVAAAVNGFWYSVLELIFGLAITFGARAFAMYLASKIDHASVADQPGS